jgi:hypothetical protein
MSIFYIGIHNAKWIERINIPFMISRKRLEHRKTFYKANTPYALDSGGFTELSTNGEWSITEQQYVDIVKRIVDNVGIPVFVAPQDRMCEPFVCKKSGKSVTQHIQETVYNYITLSELFNDYVYLLPVIQGYTLKEYIICIELYYKYGIDLTTYPLVGLGSVCRRQRTKEGINIIECIADLGINLHGFGLKTTALQKVSNKIVSSDSMAWSYSGRRIPNPSGKTKNLANDYDYMMVWYKELKSKVAGLNVNY